MYIQTIINYQIINMAIEKILATIQNQINELAPTLELFVQHKIHPSATDCDLLKKQISELQEQLAVYKHLKLNKEISPSFNIHAKVSEVTIEKATPNEKIESETPIQIKEDITEQKETKFEAENKTPILPVNNNNTSTKKISLGINDKFRIINELFKQNQTEFSIAIEQINTLATWDEVEIYLDELKQVYFWNEKNETVKLFYSLASKRFS